MQFPVGRHHISKNLSVIILGFGNFLNIQEILSPSIFMTGHYFPGDDDFYPTGEKLHTHTQWTVMMTSSLTKQKKTKKTTKKK